MTKEKEQEKEQEKEKEDSLVEEVPVGYAECLKSM